MSNDTYTCLPGVLKSYLPVIQIQYHIMYNITKGQEAETYD